LREIASYIARGNAARALSFVQELQVKAVGIGNVPQGFPVVPRYELQGIRRRIYGHYSIYDRIEPSRILILTVPHAARDFETVLAPDA